MRPTVRFGGMVLALTASALALSPAFAQAPAAASAQRVVQLPPPVKSGGRPLLSVLADRHSQREFKPEALPAQVLSNLLWAAFGVNRADGRRTAPSARNWQETEIYVVMGDGAYVYDAPAHALQLKASGDLRAATGSQPFVGVVPVDLVYVADLAKTGNSSNEDRLLYTGAHAGFIAENVYLFCASEGLATVVRGLVDRAALGAKLGLRSDQRITLTQSVGYPKQP